MSVTYSPGDDARTQCAEELRRYALGIPSLERAARDGYDVADGVAAHVADVVAAQDGGALLLVEGAAAYEASHWEERKNPRPGAFELLDRVSAQVSRVVTPPCLEVLLLRIQRFTPPATSRATRAPYTAVMVSVRSPCTRERLVVFRAEAEPPREDNDG
jgi:hypothetical protein